MKYKAGDRVRLTEKGTEILGLSFNNRIFIITKVLPYGNRSAFKYSGIKLQHKASTCLERLHYIPGWIESALAAVKANRKLLK